MTIKSHRDLVCWQLSVELRREVQALVAESEARGDRRFCEQISSSARSSHNNIAEGFGRSDPTFRRHLDIAMASLKETEDHLDEARDAGYLSVESHRNCRTLAKRAWVAAKRLYDFLEPPRRPGRPGRPSRPA